MPCYPVTGNALAVTVLAMLGRLLITYSFNTSLNMIMEITPTVVRGQGVAFTKVLGQCCSFLSPYIVHSVRKLSVVGRKLLKDNGIGK